MEIGNRPCREVCDDRKQRGDRIRYASGIALTMITTLLLTSGVSTAFHE
jgi:hypothetical protein